MNFSLHLRRVPGGKKIACFLDDVLSLKAVGGAEEELKLNSSCELLVSFVCRKGENIGNFGNGPHNTSACKTYDPVN